MVSSSQHAELIAAVRQAGELLLSLWPGSAGQRAQLQTESKADGTLVTQADLGSNRVLIDALTRLFPNDAILSEESPFSPEELRQAQRVWVIDPLDGTRSFVNGLDDFSVLVALCENSLPVYGVMFFPARDQLVTAEQGSPALCNGVTLAVSKTVSLQPGRIYIRNFECRRPELASPMMDSGLALLQVARGELDGAIIRMTTHREWDIAAPTAVIRAAGGTVTTETASQIQFGQGAIDFQYLIASNGLIHKQLQDVI
jgi:myo-inositol-1(or 4)-monophosphatase